MVGRVCDADIGSSPAVRDAWFLRTVAEIDEIHPAPTASGVPATVDDKYVTPGATAYQVAPTGHVDDIVSAAASDNVLAT